MSIHKSRLKSRLLAFLITIMMLMTMVPMNLWQAVAIDEDYSSDTSVEYSTEEFTEDEIITEETTQEDVDDTTTTTEETTQEDVDDTTTTTEETTQEDVDDTTTTTEPETQEDVDDTTTTTEPETQEDVDDATTTTESETQEDVDDTTTTTEVVVIPEYSIDVSGATDASVTINKYEYESFPQSYDEGSNLEIKITPDDDYRIIIKMNDEVVSNDTDGSCLIDINSLNQDISILVECIALYTVSSEAVENGSVALNGYENKDLVVDENSQLVVSINPNDGYTIESLTINDEEITDFSVVDSNIIYTIDEVTKDIYIVAVFKQVNAGSMDSVDFNIDDAIRVDEEFNVYVFEKDTALIFSATQEIIETNTDEDSDSSVYDLNADIEDDLDDTETEDNVEIEEETDEATEFYNVLGIKVFVAYGDEIAVFGGYNQTDVEVMIADLDDTMSVTGISLYYQASDELVPCWHEVDFEAYTIEVDMDSAEIIVSSTTANEYGYYNDDVTVYVAAEDMGVYSGIESITYNITSYDINGDLCETKGTLYEYSDGEDIINTWNDNSTNITVDAQYHNADGVIVEVIVTDRVGNVSSSETTLNINSTAPILDITYEAYQNSNAEAGYYTSAIVTVAYNDRASTFDSLSAYDSIVINVTDIYGETLSIDKCKIIEINEDEQTIIISFDTDGIYEWNISYTNKAGLSSEEVDFALYEFVVDTSNPAGSVSIENDIWEKLLETLTFGLYSKTAVQVTATAEDEFSPVIIEYYQTDDTTVKTYSDLEDIAFSSFEPYYVDPDTQFVVYLKITDYAGNYSYISSNGYIVDSTSSNVLIVPSADNESTGSVDDDIYGVYHTDVTVEVAVSDDEPYSGIQTVDYWITADGVITQEGNLYTFDNENPTQEELVDTFKGEIIVDSILNNSSNVTVWVKTVDNAGNETIESITLDIDITAPVIEIEFDNNSQDKENYFDATRTATIVITERSEHFDSVKATEGISITAVDVNGEVIEDAYVISEWIQYSIQDSQDSNYVATVYFKEDANYEWSIEYTDEATNQNDGVTIADTTIATFDFTVDTTKPTGTITIEASLWDILIETLTFGLYSNTSIKVSATAQDETSPVYIEYYQTDEITAIEDVDLDKVDFMTFEEYYVDRDEQLTVYLKISDYAGNYIYISSNGYIVDTESSDITIIPEASNGFYSTKESKYGTYNSDVTVDISIVDDEPYSGIKTVDYWITADGVTTQEGNLYTFDIEDPLQTQLLNSFDTSIVVDSELNNSTNVIVWVYTEDNAGNTNTQSIALDIDITAPTIEVSFDNNDDNEGNTNFDATRSATIVITERENHFSSSEVVFEFLATDALGLEVENAYTISEWITVVDEENEDATTHTVTVYFQEDANYEWCVEYTDEADNTNNGVIISEGTIAAFDFTVDTTAPTGTITATSTEGRESTWSSLKTSLTFGFYSSQQIVVSATSDDLTSLEIASVEYFKVKSSLASDGTDPFSKAALDDVDQWQDFDGLTVSSDEQFVVYLKITDLAGNYTYISTNGLIVDHTAPSEELTAPEITFTIVDESDLYTDDVEIYVEVTDPLVGGTYSGLKTISYNIYNMGEVTQTGTLFVFDNDEPTQSDLIQTWVGEIVVDSELNNSNDVVIEFFAEDNSYNATESEISIKIDITAPEIEVSYDNNLADSSSYFDNNRTATIVITERNFDPDDVEIALTNTDGVIPTVSSWTKTAGTGNEDDTAWTAEIEYTTDGDYEFAISYTDLAGWACSASKVDYGSSVCPTSFTIDKTSPTISVSYDNNSTTNSNYYSSQRMATIVINEHNLEPNTTDSDRIIISMSATDDGVESSIPVVSSWTTEGDIHTATIYYSADSLYTFDITVEDKAGNDSAEYDEDEFYVDKTAPSISITDVENYSANSADVIPVITYSDTNYDSNNVSIVISGANRGILDLDGTYSQITNGETFVFNNFEFEEEIDDIYTLTATLTDMAGNTSTETIVFSVNRYGSTYNLSDETVELNNTYTTTPIDVVIVETNPDELSDVKVTLFKNSSAIVLSEGSDYEVNIEGGDGQWYQYTYSIFAENFEDDAVYSITVESSDAAGNYAKNDQDTKDTLIEFGVDNTLPIINLINISSDTTYALDNLTVEMSVQDNLKLYEVIVELNGEQIQTWSGDELEELIAAGGNFTFDIAGDSTDYHTLLVYAVDAAGNGEAVSDELPENSAYVEKFYVTTNLWIRYYTNEPLFYGSISGTILFAGLAVFILVYKKKKLNV